MFKRWTWYTNLKLSLSVWIAFFLFQLAGLQSERFLHTVTNENDSDISTPLESKTQKTAKDESRSISVETCSKLWLVYDKKDTGEDELKPWSSRPS